MKRILILFFWVSFLCLNSVLSVSAYYTYMPANVVVGQDDFVSNISGTTQTRLKSTGNSIRGVFVDVRGRLLVADSGNNRVLIWNQVPTTNGKEADLVIGQNDFVSGTANKGGSRSSSTLSGPINIYSDGNKLFVADTNSARVLIWNSFPTVNGQAADVVVGQSDMTSAATTCDSSHMAATYGLTVYNGKLIVSARSQNRVLIWNTIPTTNGRAADLVLGQSTFDSCTAQSTSSTSLNGPRGLAVSDEGKLIIVDNNNKRALIWNSFPTTNGQAADVVIGQPNFTSSAGGGGATADSFGDPVDVSVRNNRLYVADSGGSLIQIFNSIPTSNGASADLVIGKQSFTSSPNGVSVRDMASSLGVYATNNQLFAVDSGNSRLLIFNNIISSPLLSLSSVEELNSGSSNVGGGDWEGRLRMVGSVTLGERGRYTMQSVKASVNGEGFNDVTELKNSRENSSDSTIWDFSLDFSPWVSNNTTKEEWIKDKTLRESLGYTVLLKASSFNADTTQLFYFSPFKLNSVTESPSTSSLLSSSPTFSFSVNKSQWNRVKENLSSYEVHTKRKTGEWKTFLSNIPVFSSGVETNGISTFDTTSSSTVSTPEQDNYKVTYNSLTGEITVFSTDKTKTLLPGEYQIKIVALDKWGNRQSSNTLSKTIGDTSTFSSLIPDKPVSTSWFPLQITKVTNTNLPSLLSTTNQLSLSNPTQYSNPSTSYTNLTNTLNQKPTTLSSSSLTPTISGIASYPSVVTLIVSNTTLPTQTRTYTTKTLPNSTFSIGPTLYSSSYLDLYVEDGSKYNYLRRIRVN